MDDSGVECCGLWIEARPGQFLRSSKRRNRAEELGGFSHLDGSHGLLHVCFLNKSPKLGLKNQLQSVSRLRFGV